MRLTILTTMCLFLALPSASAQDLTASERASALSRVRELSACLNSQQAQMSRLLQLIGQSERQRQTARDARAREDADRAIDALIARAATAQRDARACLEGPALPSPGREVVVRDPPPDRSADSVAQAGGTVRLVEENASLGDNMTVLRAEQVDGQGQVDASSVRGAVRSVAGNFGRCYERYLDRGSLVAHQLNLVFTFHGSGAARAVTVERSTFDDATFDRCIQSAARRLRLSRAPRGGDATFSYTLRFGREPQR